MFFMLTSCESKFDNDGLAGNWQLVEWKDGSTTVKQGGLYYSFQLTLMQVRLYPSDEKQYYSRYQHQGNQLKLQNIIEPQVGGFEDKILDTPDFALLDKYGVPLTGTFTIEVLNDDNLVLSSEGRTLVFRKY